MGFQADRTAREARQARVAQAVWGLLFLTAGALFMLDNLGRIDLRGPGPYPARNAVDGDPGTRWSSGWSDPQWITVDLGSVSEISRVRLSWEAAHARAYRIEVSTDGESFASVQEVANADGGVDEHEVRARGRYVRVTGTERATRYGYSLWELEVFGPDGPLSQGQPARASSGEENLLWAFRWWPLLLVASGLPALIAPKDGGDQVLGLLLSGAGAFLQLRKLELVRWSFGEAWPILLIVAGLLLVIQALRQMGGTPTDPRTPTSEPGGSAR